MAHAAAAETEREFAIALRHERMTVATLSSLLAELADMNKNRRMELMQESGVWIT